MSEFRNKNKPQNKRYGGRTRRPSQKKSGAVDYRKLRNISKFTKYLDAHPEQGSIVVFDIETTGGNPEKNGLTEFCGLRIEGGEVVDEFQSLINPQVPIPPIVRKMTGINDRMVRNAPKIDAIMPKILEFIGDRIVVSHNTIGDLKFIRYFAESVTSKRFENFFVCTHLLSEKVLSDSPDKSLKGLAKYLNLHFEGAHRAQADALITFELYKELMKRLMQNDMSRFEHVIRYQGDYESSFRLGWGVKEDIHGKINSAPGIYVGKALAGHPIYCGSAVDLKFEVNLLNRYTEIPKQLLRKVFQTYQLDFEPCEDILTAVQREKLVNKKYGLNSISPYSHQRRINSLNFEFKSDDKIQISSGFANDQTFLALGPVYDRKTASIVLEKISTVTGELAGRSKLLVEKSDLFAIYAFLTGQSDAFSSFIKRKQVNLLSLFFSKSKEQFRNTANLIDELSRVRWQHRLHDLQEINGRITVAGRESNYVYELKRSSCNKPRKSSEPIQPAKKITAEIHFSKSAKGVYKLSQQKKTTSVEELLLWETICWLVFSSKGRKLAHFDK